MSRIVLIMTVGVLCNVNVVIHVDLVLQNHFFKSSSSNLYICSNKLNLILLTMLHNSCVPWIENIFNEKRTRYKGHSLWATALIKHHLKKDRSFHSASVYKLLVTLLNELSKGRKDEENELLYTNYSMAMENFSFSHFVQLSCTMCH